MIIKHLFIVAFILMVLINPLIAIGGDDFSLAVPLGFDDTGDTSALTDTFGNSSKDVFYVVRSNFSTSFSINLENSSFDTYLRVYDEDMSTELYSNDDYYGENSYIYGVSIPAFTNYYICIEGSSFWDEGEYEIMLDWWIGGPYVGLISPDGNSIDQSIDTNIEWYTSFMVTCDLYLDTVNPPLDIVVDNAPAELINTYSPGMLEPGTQYYWTIAGHSHQDYLWPSPIYTFRTLDADKKRIGSGEEVNLGLPIDPYSNYNYSQSIYLQSDINLEDQYIDKIWFCYNKARSLANSNSWTVYIGHTQDSFFASQNDWIPISQMTEVFSGQITPDENGLVECIFDPPFLYNNVDNLVIAVDENTTGRDLCFEEFFCTETPIARSIHLSGSQNPNPANPAGGALVNAVPNIRIQFSEYTLDSPGNIVLTLSENLMDVSWDEVPGALLYRVYVSDTPEFTPEQTNYFGFTQVNSILFDTGLIPGRSKFVKIIAVDE